MNQLNFIDNLTSNSCDTINYWKLCIDGASRGNPGKAGAGVYIIKNDTEAFNYGFSLGIKTNNQAEYLSLLVGLFFLKKYICKDDIVMIISDSQLLVRQILGEYRVKNAGLTELYQLSKHLLSDINYTIAHVLRCENTQADEMANIGIDKGKVLPQEFIDMLQTHEIPL